MNVEATVKRNGRYEYFQSSDGWHWNKVAGNGEITSVSEAYSTKGNCIAAIGRDMNDSSGYDINEREKEVEYTMRPEGLEIGSGPLKTDY